MLMAAHPMPHALVPHSLPLLQVLVLEQAARIVQESDGITCDVIDLVRSSEATVCKALI
jgi:hypothetical protein